MALATVREDKDGIYINTGGYRFRPGGVRGYDHAYDMSDGGLTKGDKIKAAHIGGSPLCRIRLIDNTYYWHSDGRYKYGDKL